MTRRGRLRLKSFDQAGVDQQPIEAPRLSAAGAGVKKPLAALENFLLLGERGIERQAGRLLHDERKIGSLDLVEPRLEHEGGEIRLVIAVANQEERLAGKVACEAIEQPRIVAKAHALTPQIFVDIGRVS